MSHIAEHWELTYRLSQKHNHYSRKIYELDKAKNLFQAYRGSMLYMKQEVVTDVEDYFETDQGYVHLSKVDEHDEPELEESGIIDMPYIPGGIINRL